MASDEKSHILLIPYSAWGHVRPMLVLATRMVLERDSVVVTMLLTHDMIERALSDVKAQFEESGLGLGTARQRIRIAAIVKTDGQDMFKNNEMFFAIYPAVYQTLLEKKPITCASTGTTFNAVPPPVVIVLDFFSLIPLRATRTLSGNDVPIICWVSTNAAYVIRHCGPPELGGTGDLGARIDAEVLKSGRNEIEVGEEIVFGTSGKVVYIAGMPPMYDYEFYPQKLPLDFPVAPLLRQGTTTLMESDGLLLTTSEKLENKGTLQALKAWLSSLKKDTYGVGPLLPLGFGSGSLSSRGATEVEAFLQSSLQSYGEKSVLLISFGSMFWPKNPEYVEELIEALLEKRMPFIFSHASPFAQLSDDLVIKVEKSQAGLLVKWSPQQYILNHPATGYFLTHCGWGGATEALGSGVPMISWPFMADQPSVSAQLSENHNVLIELVEVRNSDHGKQPIHRLGRSPIGTREAVGVEIREVIDKLRGEKGKDMTRSAARLKRELAESWEDGGDGKIELQAFLRKYVDGVGR